MKVNVCTRDTKKFQFVVEPYWQCIVYGPLLYHTLGTNLPKTLDQLNLVNFTKYLVNVLKFPKYLVNVCKLS